MALKLNLKKDELISVDVEMGLMIPSKAKIIDLKKLIESSAVYKNDIEFVRSLVENALEKSKQETEKNECEAEIQLEKIKLSQIVKQLELAKVRKKSEKNPQTLESGKPSSINDKLESLVKSIKTLAIQVPVRSESFNPLTGYLPPEITPKTFYSYIAIPFKNATDFNSFPLLKLGRSKGDNFMTWFGVFNQ
ncbi:uncharacterized protein TNCV_4100481 [Trichonephila clavipes]|nr:uncharacterized protein TNCV_4100481 [Trichonephila clavipes]